MLSIPDNSREAVFANCNAAILRAAFLELEEEEIRGFERDSRVKPNTQAFVRKLRTGITRNRRRNIMAHTLPRVMQVAACFIAVIAVGVGFALAASPAIRSWAAGVLTTSIDETPVSYIGGEPTAGYYSGAMLNDELWLLGGANNENTLYRQTAAASEPYVYELLTPENRRLIRLACDHDKLYCLYASDTEEYCGLGVIRFGKNDYTVETIVQFTKEQFKGENVDQLICGDGKLYFCAYRSDGQFPGEQDVRLFAFDLASAKLDILQTYSLGWSDSIELFSGTDGAAYIAVSGDISRINEDGYISHVVSIPSDNGVNAGGFAYHAETDTLMYLQNGVIYAAVGFDIDNTRRIAVTAIDAGQGVALNGGYALVNWREAQIFRIDDAPAEITELIVSDGKDAFADEQFIKEHENITVASDNSRTEHGGYRAMLDANALNADVWIVSERDLVYFVDAGVYAPIEHPELLSAVSRMFPGVQDFITVDGNVIAFPIRGYTYTDPNADDTALTRASGFFAVINPNSSKKALAQEYILCYPRIAHDADTLLNLYAQPELDRLSRDVSQEEVENYVQKVGDIYFFVGD